MPADDVMARRALLAAALIAATAAAGCSPSCRACSPVPSDPASVCGNFDGESARKLADAIGNSTDAPQILMLSGGGSYGAWGSGFLNGWSKNASQARPKFDLVTGSSTGAILGTWALLGNEQADASARCAYTNTSDSDVYKPALISWQWLAPWNWKLGRPDDWRAVRPWVSLKNLKPLRGLFEKYTPVEQIMEVGRIYRDEGRMFLAGTVDINIGAFCLWDMGKLAQEMLESPPEEQQARYERYRDVVMASSSNPGIFNPTAVDEDMHVDGGVRFQIFLVPEVQVAIRSGIDAWYEKRRKPSATGLHQREEPVAARGEPETMPEASRCNRSAPADRPRLYGIMNMPMEIPRVCTGDNIYNIAQRSLTVTQIQAMIGNIYEARWQLEHTLGNQGQWDFCLSHIPYGRHTWPFADEFPECQMRQLYADAFERAATRTPWETSMPGNEVSAHPCPGKKKCASQPGCVDPAPQCEQFD